MAGFGEVAGPHDILGSYAPDRFEATAEQLQACIDDIIIRHGEKLESPASSHGMQRIADLNERIADRSWPLIMIWDDLNFQLTHNLGGLGTKEESST